MTGVPQVFLSLSGKDDGFVERVIRHLPSGFAEFYRQSFQNGDDLLAAMERGISASQIFALFVSKESLKSDWVKFEIDLARIQKIKRANFRLLVFVIDDEADIGKLPKWLQSYWVPRSGKNPQDVARYIRNVLSSPAFATSGLVSSVIGRGALLDLTTRKVQQLVAETQVSPNIFLFPGVSGVGRRTFARYFLKQAFPSLPDLTAGPDLLLAEFADIADFFRGLRELVEPNFSIEVFEEELISFNGMDLSRQAKEIAASIGYFGNLGQAVFAYTGSGLFGQRGEPKPWVFPLFNELSKIPQSRLCLITNRQFREGQLYGLPNVVQALVQELQEGDTRALITDTCTAYGIKRISPTPQIIRSIGGHPQVAKAAVRLMSQTGAAILEQNPSPLFSIQDEILSENLSVQHLSEMQQEILCVLSWVPQLRANLLERVIGNRFPNKKELYTTSLQDLLLGCLMQHSEDQLLISPSIRSMFRRNYGFGKDGLLDEFSKELNREWKDAEGRGEFDGELFDAFVFMHALEGRSLPQQFRKLLMPSTLHSVVIDTYNRNHHSEDALRRVVGWGELASTARMDDTVREEILATVVKAHIRLGEFSIAEQLLLDFERRGYRSVHFLRGFLKRRQGKYEEAIPPLKMAITVNKKKRSAIQELANCYMNLDMTDELEKLLNEYESTIRDSAALLDFKVMNLIFQGRIEDARAGIRNLEALPYDDGRSSIRRAQIMITEGRFSEAEKLLTDLFNRGIGERPFIWRWRAIAASHTGNFQLAEQDIKSFAASKPGSGASVERLRAHMAMAKGRMEEALERSNQIGVANSPDRILRAQILEKLTGDVSIPLSQREKYRAEAIVLRARSTGKT